MPSRTEPFPIQFPWVNVGGVASPVQANVAHAMAGRIALIAWVAYLRFMAAGLVGGAGWFSSFRWMFGPVGLRQFVATRWLGGGQQAFGGVSQHADLLPFGGFRLVSVIFSVAFVCCQPVVETVPGFGYERKGRGDDRLVRALRNSRMVAGGLDSELGGPGVGSGAVAC